MTYARCTSVISFSTYARSRRSALQPSDFVLGRKAVVARHRKRRDAFGEMSPTRPSRLKAYFLPLPWLVLIPSLSAFDRNLMQRLHNESVAF